MRFLPAGDRALLVELASLEQVHQLRWAVERAGLAIDAVPGWCTLLVTSRLPAAQLEAALRELHLDTALMPPTRTIEIPVTYDGADLDAVAMACGLTVREVVELHLAPTYTVAFLGFSRGFPYLAGLPERLHLPRRDTPRSRVPAGSVGIALDACGIYPQASPGGWHLLATTDVQLFDPGAQPPNALLPRDRVRFTQASA